MSIVLSLTGQINLGDRRLSRSEAREWLAGAAVWFESVGDSVLDAQIMRNQEDKPVLLVMLHPSSSPVEVRLGASGKVRVSATTTPTGPGYHQHLCNLLGQLATDFGFNWVADDCSDPTDYMWSRNKKTVERSFLQWLAATCSAGPSRIGLSSAEVFTYPGEVLSPLGPRSRAWMSAVVSDPELGRDFFAWWQPDLDSTFYRNRALARLWCDFPWRQPLTDQEGEVADQIANDLVTAFKLDPAAELPWSEWLELLESIKADDEGFCVTPNDRVLSIELWKRAGPVPAVPRDSSSESRPPPIGYRRYPVRVMLDGGWSLLIPGEFAQEWDAQRNWTAWNRTRTIWFRQVGFTKPGGGAPTTAEALDIGCRTLPEGDIVPGLEMGVISGSAVYGAVEEDGRTVWRLSGVAAAPGQLAVCHVYSENSADRDWATQIWQSLQYCSGDQKPG